MSNFTYKCIRRVVNVLALVLIVNFGVCVSYIFFGPRILEKIESVLVTGRPVNNTAEHFLSQLAISSIFMAMLFSTSVNSKSKFTMKVSIVCGIFFILFTGFLLLYFAFICAPTIQQGILGKKGTLTEGSQWIIELAKIFNGDTGTYQIGSSVEAIRIIEENANNEIKRVEIMIGVSLGIGTLITILLLVGIHTKISKDKPEQIKECEIHTRSVGFNTPMSLRVKK